jgi:ankyrin repeat protein
MPSNSPSYRVLLDYIEAADATSLNETIVESDMTLLSVAASERRLDVIQMLLQRGADVNQCGRVTGRDALSLAAESGSAECIRLLLKHGARVDRFDRRGRNALAYALASHARDKDAAVRVLLEAEDDVDELIRKLRNMQARIGEPMTDEGELELDESIDRRMRFYRLHEDGTRTCLGYVRRHKD